MSAFVQGGFLKMAVPCLALMLLVFAGLYLLNLARAQSERELASLLRSNTELYLERLRNNRRLRLVFRRGVLLLYQLQGYMLIGDDENCLSIISQLEKERLQPRDRLSFISAKLSYFAQGGMAEEARASLKELEGFLRKTRADENGEYKKLLKQARQIVAVYVEHDISLIPKLISEAAATKDGFNRGLLQFRIAKLSHYAGDSERVDTYLRRAGKNLKNTEYNSIINAALTDHSVLERQ